MEGELGGEQADIVAKEKAVYDRFIEAREAERKMQEEETLDGSRVEEILRRESER